MLKDILIYRPFLILCIIIGHCFGIYNGSFDNTSNLPGYLWYTYMNPLLISFQLYAFVFISGYLYAHNKEKNESMLLKIYVLKRFKRLYLPCLLFGVLYIVCFDEWDNLGGHF